MRYDVVLTRPARRDLDKLPAAVAAAIVEFMAGPLADNPQRVGKELMGEAIGLYSARRGAYRIIYRILDERVEVEVVRLRHRRVAHRRD